MTPEAARARPSEPEIAEAVIAAGHDGSAELVLWIRHPGGHMDSLTLDAECAARLMADCDVSSIEALPGQPWERLLRVLG